MKKNIMGIIPPVITCFNKKGFFDEISQRGLIRFLLPYINGLFPGGTYGSGPLMNIEERKKLAEVIIDEVNGRIPVIVHVGALNTSNTIELAKHAESSGADAVASIPPYYYKYDEADLINYFIDLINAVKIPVFAYNNPSVSNNPLTPHIVNELAKEGLAGLKDSSFDLITFYSFLDTVKFPGFSHIIGTEAIAAPAVEAGAKGIVSGLANVWPELMNEFWNILQTNDGRKAGMMQIKVNKARSILKLGSTLVVCYEVLRMRGINAGYPRKPFNDLTDEIRKNVKKQFVELGLLT